MAMRETERVPGRRVVWLQVPRGGSCSPDRSSPVDAVVTGVGLTRLTRVRIRVQRATVESVERWASPGRLLPVGGESFAHAVATSRGPAPEDRGSWLRVCEAEGKEEDRAMRVDAKGFRTLDEARPAGLLRRQRAQRQRGGAAR